MQRLGGSTGADDAQFLLSTFFDPQRADFESQWTAFSIDDYGLSYRPWFTRSIIGFDNVTGFYVSQTISALKIDTIVLDVHPTSNVVPEPTNALLLGLGLAGIEMQGRRQSLRPLGVID